MKNISEEDAQDMVHSIMPQLIKDGFIEPVEWGGNYGILIPKGQFTDPDKVNIPALAIAADTCLRLTPVRV